MTSTVFYGTNLEENRDIVRIPYSGIHASEKRGYFLGKDEDSIIVAAWSNAHGDEIAAGNPDRLAIQYSYPGTGRECTETGIAAATPGTVTEEQVPPERVHVKEQKPEISSRYSERRRQPGSDRQDPLRGNSPGNECDPSLPAESGRRADPI